MTSSQHTHEKPDLHEPLIADPTLVAILRRRAEQQPTETAFIFLRDGETSEERITYAELDQRAQQIAAQLQQLGAAGSRVLLLYPPGLDYIAAFFGCLYAGAVAVPAYPPRLARLDRHLSRLRTIVADAQPTIALATEQICAAAAPVLHDDPDFGALRWLATDTLADAPQQPWQPPVICGATLALLQYTSGSTAAPKGVMLTHGNLLHNLAQIQQAFGHTRASCGVIWLPPYHDMGLIGGILQPLYVGFPVVLMPPIAFLQRPARWLQAISRYRATTSGGPSFAYELCLDGIKPVERAQLDLSSWRVAFNGAEPIRSDILERFSATFASQGFRPEVFYPCYGLAEATLIVTGGEIAAPPLIRHFDADGLEQNQVIERPAEAPRSRALVGCGQPLLGQRLAIIDPTTHALCPPGTIGEICVGGPSVAQGYWRQPDASAVFQTRIAVDQSDTPFLRTGDLGFIQQDALFVTGRLKELIIIRGRNHYPQDIERTVERSHPDLRPNAGAAFSVEVAGAERLVVVHEIQRQHGELAAMLDAIQQAVASEHEIQPYVVALVKPGAIPKTTSGKIQRRACRAQFLAGTIEPVGARRLDEADDTRAPLPTIDAASLRARPPAQRQPALEQLLRALVSHSTGIAIAAIDPQQPITALGLDSLAALELQHRLEQQFDVRLPMVAVLDGSSIEQLATALAAALDDVDSRLPALTATPAPVGDYRLTYGQQALWFLHQLDPNTSAYNIASALHITSPVAVPALHQAFQTLVDRHAALRTTFRTVDGQAVQHVHAQATLCYEEIDARDWTSAMLEERVTAEANRPFDIEQGPLLGVHLFRRAADELVLLLKVHHLVSDLWSLTLLVQELGQLYQGAVAGQAVTLPPLAVQYVDYARWEAAYATSDEWAAHWRYWQQQLAADDDPAPLMLDLPTDRLRPPIQTSSGGAQQLRLSAELTEDVHRLARSHGATPYMVLLATFQTLLARLSGQDDLLVGTPTTGRLSAALAPVVGYFVNPLVLRARLADHPTWSSFLGAVRQTVLDAFAHQAFPFAVLAERLQPLRDPSRTPVVQVMFMFQQAPGRESEGVTALAVGSADSAIALGGLTASAYPLAHQATQFDLTLIAAEVAGRLELMMQYSADLFEPTTIASMLDRFATLLSSIVVQPDQPIQMLPVLSAAEQRLLRDWNATELPYDADGSLVRAFEAQVARTPHATALVFDEEQLSYQELNARANRLARHLRTLGVGPDRLVGICLERSTGLVVALLGILKAGSGYVPLDPAYPAERLQWMLQDAQVAALVTEQRLLARLPAVDAPVVCLDRDAARIAGQSSAPLPELILPDTTAYVIYTSGSTGRPKGVIVSHRNVLNFLAGMDQRIERGPSDTLLAVTSISFDISVLELFWTLSRGIKVVLLSSTAATGQDHQTGAAPAASMQFSLFYFASTDSALSGDKYRLLLEGARFADQHGFSAVWTPERHFHAFGGLYPNPSVTSAALATITERIQIRAGSVVLPLHNPIRVAEEWSVVDNLSHGRTGIAFASGWHINDFVFEPDHYDRRRAVMIEGITTVQRLWRGETVQRPIRSGDSETLVDLRLFPQPVQPELPIWLTAAGNPDTFVQAGALGANVLTHLLGQSIEEVAANVQCYRAARAAHGHDPEGGCVTLMLHTFIGDDRDAVREQVRGPFTNYLLSSVDLIARLIHSLELPLDLNTMSPQDMDDLLAFAFDRYVETSALFGTPQECARLVERLAGLGINEIACLIDFGVDPDAVLGSLDQLARLVAQFSEPPARPTASLATQAARHQPTLLQCTPSMMQLLLHQSATIAACGSLRTLLLGGEALPPTLARQIKQTLPARLLNMYGPTETTIWSATHEIVDADAPITVGRPIANTQAYILDAQLQPVPIGVAGELYLGGAGVTRGYLRRPELTATHFIPNPFAERGGEGERGREGESTPSSILHPPSSRLYRTGDRARWLVDGTIEHLGRVDQQVKLSGFRIEPGEIEAVLAEHPAVREAAVVVSGDDPATQRLAAYVVPASRLGLVQPATDASALLAHMQRQTLPNGLLIAHHGGPQTNTIFREVFVDEEYLRHGITLRDDACIFDVGANIGLFTLFVHQRCARPRLYCFEPIPPTFALLQANVALYGLDVHLFNCALAEQPGTAEFTFYPQAAGLSGRYATAEEDRQTTQAIVQSWLQAQATDAGPTSTAGLEEHLAGYFASERYTCPMMTLSDVLREQQIEQIDLLKIDAEKSELDVLLGIRAEDWPKIKQIVIEVHTEELRDQIEALLRQHGYDVAIDRSIVVEEQHSYVYLMYAIDPRYRAAGTTAATPAQSTPLSAEVLRTFLKERLPDYMIPAEFVLLERLPLTANHKIDRRALPALSAQRPALAVEYVVPGSKLEQTIAQIWQSVLKKERVGIHDNFFDLGGHSLMLAQAHSQLQTTLQREFPLIKLIENPTISALAAYLGAEPSAQPSFQESQARANKQLESRLRQRRRPHS